MTDTVQGLQVIEHHVLNKLGKFSKKEMLDLVYEVEGDERVNEEALILAHEHVVLEFANTNDSWYERTDGLAGRLRVEQMRLAKAQALAS